VNALWSDNRAVTVQIGAVLMLGLLVLLLTINQAAIVPAQNQNVEFAHNDRVQSDLLDVRNGLIRAATSGNTQPNAVELGTSFPSRLVAINPAPASGSLAPSSVSGNATISGAVPVDRNARAYWTNESHRMEYETMGFRYQPSYREYDTAPATIYENTVLYNEFADGQNRTLTGQSVIDGRTISLIALKDVPTRSSSSNVGMDLRAISPSSTQVRTIAVTPGEEPVTITLPTQLDDETWDELLADEPYVDDVNVADGEVTISLAETRNGDEVTYNLRTSAVTASRSVERPEPAYVTVVDGANRSVPEDTTNTLTAEVRDRYNNPVSGAAVNATFNDSVQSLSASQLRSTEQGFAPFSFEPAGDGSAQFSLADQSQQATVSLSSFSAADTGGASLQSDETQQRQSSSSGRVRFPYSASGTGSLTATISSSAASVSSALNVYTVSASPFGSDTSVRIDDDGNTVGVDHYEVNLITDYENETLFIPEGETFGPEPGETGPDADIDYTFRDFQIDGELRTENELSLQATDGAINIGSGGSVISGKELTFTATGPNGSINADGASLTTIPGNPGAGNGRIRMTTTGDISAVDATMTANREITLRSESGSIDLTDATLTIEDGGSITLDADDDIILNRTTLNIIGNGEATAEATTIYVEDAVFSGSADPLEIKSGEVEGTPAEGNTDPSQ